MFEPNENSISEALAALRGKQPGGGYLSGDDMRLIANQRKWACAPLVGEFTPNNEFLFWQAVEHHLNQGY